MLAQNSNSMRWTIKPKPETEKSLHLQKAINVSKPIADLLVQRGITILSKLNPFLDLH